MTSIRPIVTCEALAREGRALRDALTGDGQGARDRLGAAHAEARALARIDPRFEAVVERLAGLEGEVTDLATEVRGLVEAVDHDPAAIATMEERLSLLYGLERRYGPDLVAVLAHAERAALEAERLRGLEVERTARAAEDARLLEEIATAAAELSRLRSIAAVRLTAAVSETLEALGFGPAVDPELFVGREKGRDELLPWDFIDTCLSRSGLRAEYERALAGAGDEAAGSVGSARIPGQGA